jgi:cyclophilin family peptidyl-prolyl cis-trans isomerase
MRHDLRLLILVFTCLMVSACSKPETQKQTPPEQAAPAAETPAVKAPAAETPAAKAPAPNPPAAVKPASFDVALLRPSTLRAKAPAVYNVKFGTTAGDFTIKVTRAWAPNGADRFYNLVDHHFYDGAAFFRVLPGFMAQFGMSAYPQVSRAWANANIKDDPVKQSNHRGYVTFAMAGPNTRTTQVFVNTGNNERLDSDGFAAFGMVTEGMEVVDKLYSGYGEGAPDGHGPDQNLIGNRGSAYLEKSFPKLDVIKTAALVAAPSAN